MAVTFPNSPTLNQEYTAENGLIYIWDGEKWKTQGSYAGDQGLYINKDGSNTAIYADSTSVGIGTTTPSEELEVVGTALISGPSAADATLELNSDATAESLVIKQTSTLNEISSGASLPMVVGPSAAQTLSLQTDSTNRLNIDENGGVGINVTSPVFKLDVDNQIRAGRSDGYGFLGLGSHTTDTWRNWHIVSEGNGYLSFFNGVDGAGIKRATLGSNGNFGIGLDIPVSTLHVAGDTRVEGAIIAKPTSGSLEGGEVQLYNPDDVTVGAILDISAANTVRLFQIADNSYMQLGQIGGTGGSLGLWTGGAERLHVTSAGRVGIGTTNPDSILHVGGTLNTDNFITFGKRIACNESNLPVIGQTSLNGVNSDLAICATSGGGSIRFYTGNGSGGFGSNSNDERLRIDSSGNVVFGDANVSINPVTGNTKGLAIRTAGNLLTNTLNTNAPHQFRRNTNGDLVRFHMNSTANSGAISVTSSSTTYSTSSDYRLKENVVAIEGAAERVMELKPYRFNFIVDPETTVDGFLAHEAQEVVPEAVVGQKDAVDEEGSPEYQGIDQSKLVPLLTAALQEALTKIEDLETRLSQLEGN